MNPFRTSPANIAVERDFHRVDAEGHPQDILETMLSEFEGDLAKAFDVITTTNSIDDQDAFAHVLNFIGLCAVKNPRQRAMFANFQERVVNLIMDVVTSTPERWTSQVAKARASGFIDALPGIDDESIRQAWRENDYRVETPVMTHLQMEFGVFSKVLETLCRRRWTLLKAPAGQTGFICSDHPVTLAFSEPKRNTGLQGVGHGLLGTELLFPISNSLALLGTFEGGVAKAEVDIRFLAQINSRTAVYAERQIYARDSDFVYWSSSGKIRTGSGLKSDPLFQRPRPDEAKSPRATHRRGR